MGTGSHAPGCAVSVAPAAALPVIVGVGTFSHSNPGAASVASIPSRCVPAVRFSGVAFAELVLVFSVRSRLEHAWREPRNPYLFGGVAASAAIVAAALYAPGLRQALDTVALGPGELGTAVGFAVVPAAGVEVLKAAVRRGWLPGADASEGLLAPRLADDEH